MEGIPNSLKEAMACGLPVVSTLHSGIPELVEHGVSGLLVKEGDVEGLHLAMKNLIAHPDLWPEMGRMARRVVEERFDMEALNDQLVEIYKGGAL